MSLARFLSQLLNSSGKVPTAGIADTAVTPAKLSTGAPSWDSSGNVGVGTASPTATLDVTQTSVNARINIDGPNATAKGAFIRMRKGGSDTWYVGQESAVLGSGTSNNTVYWTEGATAHMFYTNGNERMRVDSAGRVTMPYQPFLFCIGSSHAEGRQTGVQDLSMQADNAGWWSTSLYRYTVQAAGNYLVIFDTMRDPQSFGNNQSFQIRKNGLSYCRAYQNVAADRHPRCSATAIFQMQAGDYVDVNRDSGTDHYSGDYTQFVVVKIS